MQSECGCAPRLVQPEDLQAAWPSILPGLKRVKAKAGADDFGLIHRRLVSREAFLFTVPEGFFILMPLHRKEPAVLVWVAYGEGGGLLHRYLPVIEDMAREIGAEHIEFESPRPGYRRVFHDWQRTGNRYTRRLT